MSVQHLYYKEYENAIRLFNYVIGVQPDYSLAYQSLGKTYYFIQDYDRAIDMLYQSISLEPDSDESYFLLSRCYSDLDDRDMEYEMLKKAIQHNPSHVLAHFCIGIIYIMNEDIESALKEYAILKTLDTEAAERLFKAIY